MGLPVLSIDDAEQKYPGFLIYITTTDASKPEITHCLVQRGISKERILNYEPYKKYLSCRFLEGYLFFDGDGIKFCCLAYNRNKSPVIPYEDTADKTIKSFLENRDSIIAELQDNNCEATNSCLGCEELTENYWLTEKRIHNIGFSTPSPCQFRCSYCVLHPDKIKNKTNISLADNLEIFEYLEENSMINERTMIDYASGEIAIQPNCEKLLSAIGKYNCNIGTNAGIYHEGVAQLLSQGNSKIVVSMDSGTKETFAKIKGVDLYDEVCENLRKYAKHGTVELKYIILPGINDNETDFDGFITLCEEIGASYFSISRDGINICNFEDDTINMIAAFLKKAHNKGIFAKVNEWGRNNKDRDKILEILKQR
jgi:molybdenum cofactor biosynthesis enzyme MoaA